MMVLIDDPARRTNARLNRAPLNASAPRTIYLNRDYAAALTTAVPKWFLVPLFWEKSPRVSVLGAESSRRRHDSTSFLEKVFFSII